MKTLLKISLFCFIATSFVRAGEKVKVHGIDSLAGQYHGKTIELNYDCGWYSDPLDSKPDGYREQKLEVDGREARVVTYSSGSRYVVAIHFPAIDRQKKDKVKLTIVGYGNSEKDLDTIKVIYESLRFKE